ncbi:MAG TPA: L,D-transpeptidase [Chitinophagaceae bacterium]|nr:L,D-transpeptidase [Chitinophagaceae bacterium]
MKNCFVLTSFILCGSLFAPETSTTFHSDKAYKRNDPGYPGPVGTVSIVIDKSDYELSVYDDKGWYATYPVVFGNNTLGDKKMQGDNNTPEGNFKIISKRVHDKWCRFLALDYPTPESREKFNIRKSRGEIPSNANIGGGIGIHGTWPHEDFVVDKYKNWTEGCISMKNEHVIELYQYTNVGTRVIIRK